MNALVPRDDLDILKYRDDDGLPVEPEWYAPILPMILINGARGIGTGYSTYIPPCNPSVIAKGLEAYLKGTAKLRDINLTPYFRGFKGTVTPQDSDFLVKGVWRTDKNTMTITELPVETWTSD